MARNGNLFDTPRCPRCRLTPRWCICAEQREVSVPFALDVLMHNRELHRPTSTGSLLHRVVRGSRQHIYHAERPTARETVVLPGHELWILHPRGDDVRREPVPANLQVLLLDGSWRESARMAQSVATWGRLIRLPEQGPTRNRLRDQENAGNYSTAEALIFLLETLGYREPAEALRLQFELHVYAALRTRGAKERAEQFLATSPIREAFPELLAALQVPRPRD